MLLAGLAARLPGNLRGQGPAGLVVAGVAAWALALSVVELVAAAALRVDTGTLWGAGNPEDPLYESGTSLGFYATLFFTLNFILAARWHWVETLFAGAARVYALHAFAGKTALTFVLLHVGLLVLQALPDGALVGTYLIPGRDWSYTLGTVGTLGLLALVALTLWIRLPYRTWYRTHWLMIVPFLGGTLHAILLQVDWYMVVLTLAGAYAWFDGVVLLPRRGTPARVVAAQTLGEIRELVLAPDRPFPASAGQFVLLGHRGQRHPFSLSRIDAAAGQVRVSARMLGDFTRALGALGPDASVTLHGPYGHFGADILARTGPQLWIAGGIGITPFLSALHALSQTRPAQPLRLVWSVRGADAAVYRAEIEGLMARMPNARFQVHDSQTHGRLNARAAAADQAHDLVCICGPAAMSDDLCAGFASAGVPPGSIITERFALR